MGSVIEIVSSVDLLGSRWKWSDDSDATLEDCFASTDWNMFRIEEYTTSVIGLINKCINEMLEQWIRQASEG